MKFMTLHRCTRIIRGCQPRPKLCKAGLLMLVISILSAAWSVAAAAGSAAIAAASSSAATLEPTPQFRRYGAAEGLSDAYILALMQSRQGYLWIGDEANLSRFDGSGFRHWRHQAQNPVSASDSAVIGIAGAADSGDPRLWIASFSDGLARYDPRTETFEHWRHDKDDPKSLASNALTSDGNQPLAVDAKGSLWIGLSNAGLDRMRDDQRGFDHLRHDAHDPNSLVSDEVTTLLSEADGRLWIGTRQGLDLRHPDGHIEHWPLERPAQEVSDRAWSITSLARDGKDLVVGTLDGAYRIDGDGPARRMAAQSIPAQRIHAMVVDQQGRLWLGGTHGLYMRDTDGSYHHYVGTPLLQHALPDDDIEQLLLDREGGLWIGTRSGLAYLAPDWNDFSHIASHFDEQASRDLADDAVAASSANRLWVSRGNTLERIDLALGRVESVDPKLLGGFRLITTMVEDPRDRLWLSASGGGTYVLEHKQLRKVPLKRRAFHIAIGDEGHAYLNAMFPNNHDGVYDIDPDTLRPQQLALADADAERATINDMRWHQHALWLSSDAGLMRWAPGDAHAQYVEGIARRPINTIDLRDDRLWLISEDRAYLDAYRWNGHRAFLIESYALDGLPSNNIWAMHTDALGRTWLFTEDYGLWRYDPGKHLLHHYGLEHGLANVHETGQFGPAEFPDGRLYMATNNGVFGFIPEAIGGTVRSPPVVLESISVRQHDGQLQHLPPDVRTMSVRWNDRDLTISARALSYIAPERNHFRFQLVGFDADWIATDTNGDRSFSQLSGGDYTLRVQAAGPDGTWDELPEPLHIHVDYPPWLRWWAWLCYATLLALLFMATLWMLRARQRQQHRMELLAQESRLARAASESKTNFLAELGHEIRTPMTGVLGMAELLLTRPLAPTERDYVQTIQNSGAVLLTLVNDALDLARIETGRLQLSLAPFDPRELLYEAAALGTGKAASKGLDLSVDIAESTPALVVGDAVRIKQILFNLISNALKFTTYGGVRLTLEQRAEGLFFAVQDSGPGISAADQQRLFQHFVQLDSPERGTGSGLGLAICRELVALMDGRIELESGHGQGSVFYITLPLQIVDSTGKGSASIARNVSAAWRLLLIEDDIVIAAVIRGLLEAQGHAVTHVINGLHALTHMAEQSYDAVLIDLDLPGLDGFQWAQLIRSRETDKPHLPLLAITARSGGNEEAQARAAGMNGFLRKPLSGEQLAQALTDLLQPDRQHDIDRDD